MVRCSAGQSWLDFNVLHTSDQMKKIAAFKYGYSSGQILEEPIIPIAAMNHCPVYYGVNFEKDVMTIHGTMKMVEIRHNIDISNPDCDVGAIVGKVRVLNKSGVLRGVLPELWLWDCKLWMKAESSDGSSYYRNKLFALYHVEVHDENDFLSSLNFGINN